MFKYFTQNVFYMYNSEYNEQHFGIINRVSSNSLQWRIQDLPEEERQAQGIIHLTCLIPDRRREGLTPSGKFLHFHSVFGKNWSNSRFAPPLGNSGSATGDHHVERMCFHVHRIINCVSFDSFTD